jgi:hypothetical protein
MVHSAAHELFRRAPRYGWRRMKLRKDEVGMGAAESCIRARGADDNEFYFGAWRKAGPGWSRHFGDSFPEETAAALTRAHRRTSSRVRPLTGWREDDSAGKQGANLSGRKVRNGGIASKSLAWSCVDAACIAKSTGIFAGSVLSDHVRHPGKELRQYPGRLWRYAELRIVRDGPSL